MAASDILDKLARDLFFGGVSNPDLTQIEGYADLVKSVQAASADKQAEALRDAKIALIAGYLESIDAASLANGLDAMFGATMGEDAALINKALKQVSLEQLTLYQTALAQPDVLGRGKTLIEAINAEIASRPAKAPTANTTAIPEALATKLADYAKLKGDTALSDIQTNTTALAADIAALNLPKDQQAPLQAALGAALKDNPVLMHHLLGQLKKLQGEAKAGSPEFANLASLTFDLNATFRESQPKFTTLLDATNQPDNTQLVIDAVSAFKKDNTLGADIQTTMVNTALTQLSPDQLLELSRHKEAGDLKAAAESVLALPHRLTSTISLLTADKKLREDYPMLNYLSADQQKAFVEQAKAAAQALPAEGRNFDTLLAEIKKQHDLYADKLRAELAAKAADTLTNRDVLQRVALDTAAAAADRAAAQKALTTLNADQLDIKHIPADLTRGADGAYIYQTATDREAATLAADEAAVQAITKRINEYAQLPLKDAFTDIQTTGETLAKDIATLTPAQFARLNERINDSQINKSPIHAAYLNYFIGEAMGDAAKTPPQSALLATLKGFKDDRLNALTQEAKAAAQLPTTLQLIDRINQWETGLAAGGTPLPAYNDNNEVKGHMVTAAMDELGTGQLMAIAAHLTAQKATITDGTLLPRSGESILARAKALVDGPRNEEAARINAFKDAVIAKIPGFAHLRADMQQKMMDEILLNGGKKLDAKELTDKTISALAAEQGTILAQRVKEDVFKRTGSDLTNRDFLLRKLYDDATPDLERTAAKAALEEPSNQAVILGLAYDATKLPFDGKKFSYDHTGQGRTEITLEQLGRMVKQYAEKPLDGTLADNQRIAGELANALRDNPSLHSLILPSIRQHILTNPIHAAYLSNALNERNAGFDSWKLNEADRKRIADAIGPRLGGMLSDAKTLAANPNASAQEILDTIQTNWLQGKTTAGQDLPADDKIPDNLSMARLALNQLNTGQLMAAYAKYTSGNTDNQTNEQTAILSELHALVYSPERLAQKTAIDAFTADTSLAASFPGYALLSNEQKAALKEKATIIAGAHLAANPSNTLDADFVKGQTDLATAVRNQAAEAYVNAGNWQKDLPAFNYLSAEQQTALREKIKTEAGAQLLAGKSLDTAFIAAQAADYAKTLKVETNRDFLLTQALSADTAAPAARAALGGEKALPADALNKPYVAAQLVLGGTGDQQAYSSITPRPINERGKPTLEMFVSLGLKTDAEKNALLTGYHDTLIDKTLAQLKTNGVTVADDLAATLKTQLRARGAGELDSSFRIKDWLATELPKSFTADQTQTVVGALNATAAAYPAGLHTKLALKDLNIGTIEARDVVGGYQQAAERLLKSSTGLVGETYDPKAPKALNPFILPDQALAQAAAIVTAGLEATQGKEADPHLVAARDAAGTLATIVQLESIERMSKNPAYANTVALLKAEVATMPDYARLTAMSPADLAAEKLKQRDTLLTGTAITLDALKEAGIIDEAQHDANQAVLAQINQRSELTDAQNRIRGDLLGNPAIKNTELMRDKAYADRVHETLRTLPANATAADAALTLAEKLSTPAEGKSQTRLDFLIAQQAATAAAILKAGKDAPKELTDRATALATDITALKAKPDANTALPFRFDAKTGMAVVEAAHIQQRVKEQLDAQLKDIPTLSAYGEDSDLAKARATAAKALDGKTFSSVAEVDAAVAEQLAAQKSAMAGSLKPAENSRDFLTHTMLTGTPVQAAAAKAQYEALKTAAGDSLGAVLSAPINVFKLKGDKVELDAEKIPGLASALPTDTVMPESLKTFLKTAPEPTIYTKDNLITDYTNDLPPAVVDRLRALNSNDLLPGITAPVVGDGARTASLDAAYQAAIDKIGNPQTPLDKVALEMLRAKQTLLKGDSNDREAATQILTNGAEIIAKTDAKLLADTAQAAGLTFDAEKREFAFKAVEVSAVVATPAAKAEQEALERALSLARQATTALPKLTEGFMAPPKQVPGIQAEETTRLAAAHAQARKAASDNFISLLQPISAALNNHIAKDDHLQLDTLVKTIKTVTDQLDSGSDQERLLSAKIKAQQAKAFGKYWTKDGTLDVAAMERDGAFVKSRESRLGGIAFAQGLVAAIENKGTGLAGLENLGVKPNGDLLVDRMEAGGTILKGLTAMTPTDGSSAIVATKAEDNNGKALDPALEASQLAAKAAAEKAKGAGAPAK